MDHPDTPMKSILIIEDEPQIQMNLEQILELGGYQVFVAGDGQAGLDIAHEHHPNLIVSDIMMPRLDGYGVLAALRQDPIFATTPVILLTAKADRPDLRRGMELGADDYITKPFTPSELLAAVDSRLRKQADQNQVQAQKLGELRTNISRSLPHELNTPLNAILSFTALLLDQVQQPDEWDPDEAHEMLTFVQDSANRLYHTIQNFLLYTDLELQRGQGRTEDLWQNSAIEFPLAVWEGVALSQADRYDRQPDLVIQIPDATLLIPEFYGRKVLEELVDNACKFSEPGTPIEVVGEVQTDGIRLTVINQGRGMTPEQISQVGAYVQFERRIYEQQGSGLGLAIVQHISTLMGGTLAITSQPLDSGLDADRPCFRTTVTLILPDLQPLPPPAPHDC